LRKEVGLARRKAKEKKEKKEKARQRAQVILAVRSGRITATEGAKQLGVSRKTYYQWEKRGLEGMMRAIEEQESGRPPEPMDGEKEELRRKVAELEDELETAKQSEVVRRILSSYEEWKSRKENRGKKNRR
jgi:transposase-like protein